MENVNNTIDTEELVEEVKDVVAKLQDVLEYLNSNKELDATQITFLKMHNIV
ncbi:hypothetical protein D3C71_1847720 [compost metagenome]